MMAAARDLPVLIIGAGITGLLVAQGLKQASIPFRIFDGEPSANARAREWTVSIHWSMPDLIRLLPTSLHPRLQEARGDPFHESSSEKPPIMPLFNLETGDLIKAMPQPGMIRVSRGRMRALCAVEIEVEYGKECEELVYEDEESVTVRFMGGGAVRGLCVIGADGPRSVVRRSLLGVKGDVKSGGVTQYTVLLKYADADTAKKVRSVDVLNAIGYHPKGLVYFQAVQNVLDPDNPKTWTFQILVMWKPDQNQTESAEVVEDNATKLTTMKTACNDLAEPFRSAVQEIPDGTKTWCDKIHYWLPEPWDNHNGRATLVGDAAHPMLPYRGQGLNHCIRDAALLVTALASARDRNETLEKAIKEYEDEMIPRAVAEVKSSVENTELIVDWNRLMDSPVMKFGSARTS